MFVCIYCGRSQPRAGRGRGIQCWREPPTFRQQHTLVQLLPLQQVACVFPPCNGLFSSVVDPTLALPTSCTCLWQKRPFQMKPQMAISSLLKGKHGVGGSARGDASCVIETSLLWILCISDFQPPPAETIQCGLCSPSYDSLPEIRPRRSQSLNC